MSKPFKIKYSENGNILFVEFASGELSLFHRPEFEAILGRVGQDHTVVVFDMAPIESIDSSTLSLFLKIYKELKDSHRQAVMTNVNSNVAGILGLTKVDYLIPVVNDRKTLLEQYKD